MVLLSSILILNNTLSLQKVGNQTTFNLLSTIKFYSFIIYFKIYTTYVNVDEKFWNNANVKSELQVTIQRTLKLIDYMMVNHT